MTRQKKLLIVTPYIPYPPSSGGAIAQYEITDCIRNFLEITMTFPVEEGNWDEFEELQALWPNVNFKPYLPTAFEKLHHNFLKVINHGWHHRLRTITPLIGAKKLEDKEDRDVLTSTTIFKTSTIDPGIKDHVLKILSENTYDLVQVDFAAYLALGKVLPPTVQRIFVHHELLFARESTELKILNRTSEHLDSLLERNKSREIDLLSAYDKIVTLSEDDKLKLVPQIQASKIIVSPFVIRGTLDEMTEYSFNNQLIFIGGQGHLPNTDGLRWFVVNCWPRLLANFPMLKLMIIGNWSPETINWIPKDSGIEFTGFVENLADVVKNSISIIPIRIGSGIRMKIIDTINNGIPFVTTTIGVEGLNFQNDLDCLIADEPHQFCEGIERIINDEELAQRLISQSQNTLANEYSIDSIVAKRLKVYGIHASSFSAQEL